MNAPSVNKTILSGTQDELQAKLTVLPPPGSTEPLRFQITRVELVGDDDFGSPSLGAVPFTCEFASSSCTFRWQAPMVAGRFTGDFSERLDNGALVIEAGVEVQRRLFCIFSANLCSADNEAPLHSLQRRMIVHPSIKSIPMTTTHLTSLQSSRLIAH